MSLHGEIEIRGVRVEAVGFEGRAGHVFILVDPMKRPRGRVNDGYCPSPDFGHLWIREEGGAWVASGSVSARLVGDRRSDIDRLVDFVADELLAVGEQMATRVEVVDVRLTHILSGEEGLSTVRGTGSRPGDGPVPSS